MSEPNTRRPGTLDRRTVVGGGAALAAALALPRPVASEPVVPRPTRQPAVYISHGSPALATDRVHGPAFTRWMEGLARPKAILCISAHFQRRPATIGATRTVPLIYDFGGFPRALYEIKWPAPGAPKLARRVQTLLREHGGARMDPRRGHDHGTWVPLKWMVPEAAIPTLSLSLPTQDPRQLFRLGRTLRPLRDEGVMIIGSGSLTHNLRERYRGRGIAPWASAFDTWGTKVTQTGDWDALRDWTRKAPDAKRNHPTAEHFVPLLIAAGAQHQGEATSFPITGWASGTFTRRCIQFG